MSSTHRERVGIDPSEKKRLLYLDRLKATPLFYDKQTLPRQSMGIVTASLSWERTVQQRKFLLLSAPKKCLKGFLDSGGDKKKHWEPHNFTFQQRKPWYSKHFRTILRWERKKWHAMKKEKDRCSNHYIFVVLKIRVGTIVGKKSSLASRKEILPSWPLGLLLQCSFLRWSTSSVSLYCTTTLRSGFLEGRGRK